MTYIYRISVRNGELDIPDVTKKHVLAYVIAGTGNYCYAILDNPNLCVRNVHRVKPLEDDHDIMMILFFFASCDEEKNEGTYRELTKPGTFRAW